MEQPELEGPLEGYQGFYGEEIEASEDSDKEVTAEVVNSNSKARSTVLVKNLVSYLK